MRLAARLAEDPRLDAAPEVLADRLDEAAARLEGSGAFEVIRNPLPLIYAEDAGLLTWSRASLAREFDGVAGAEQVLAAMDGASVTKAPVRRWYFATQNNALRFREEDGTRTVLLPTYAHGAWRSLAVCERHNAALWTALGYRVSALCDFNAFARKLGSVRCAAKLFSSPSSLGSRATNV